MKKDCVLVPRCIYCGEIVSLHKRHFGIEFINGYPSPCRMNETIPWIPIDKGEEWIIWKG